MKNKDRKEIGKPRMIMIHVALTLLCLFLTSWFFGLFTCNVKSDYFRVFADSCFVTGGIFTGAGIVSWCVKSGVFDSLGRASLNLEDGQTIDEYNKSRQEKRRWLKTLTICGIVCLAAAVVFTSSC